MTAAKINLSGGLLTFCVGMLVRLSGNMITQEGFVKLNVS